MRDLPHLGTIKTSPPSLAGVIERPRLTRALARLPAAAKWLQSPSGTGKSTLAASYACMGERLLVWYRLDERDNDPAFFYTEFAQAVCSQLHLTSEFPKFSTDDHDRQQDFAKRFAAAIKQELKKAALVVLDDMQCITNEEMQRALATMLAAAVNGNEFLVVSQSVAPSAFFDAIAARELALLNDADLRFDIDECREMIASLRIADTHSESIAAMTGGHAGALVLACELLRATDPASELGIETAERIHLHLLTKLVDRMPQARRDLLLLTAFIAQLTRPIAVQLAGVDAAPELDTLVENGLLHRVGAGNNEMLEAHPLIRQGIQALVRARLGAEASLAIAERSATALIQNNQSESAFALLVQIGSTKRALDTLENLAAFYAARGLTELLLSSIEKLPSALVQSNAWLCFWTGQTLLGVDEERARLWLGHAYIAFERSGDIHGMRLAAASVVTAYTLECGERRDLEFWVDRHRNAGGDFPVLAETPQEASLIMGVACAAFVNGSYPKQINADALIERLQRLLESDRGWLSDDQRVQAARLLIEHGPVFSKLELAKSTIVATRYLIEQQVGSALQRGRWLITAAWAYFHQGTSSRAIEYLSEAQTLAKFIQSSRLSFELGLTLANQWLKVGDLQSATEELERLQDLAGATPPAQRAEHARLMARLLLLQNRLSEGLRLAQEAKRLAIPAGFTGASARAFNIELVYALTANDRLSEAIDLLSEHEFEPREASLSLDHCLRFLLSGKTDLALLRSGLENAARIGFINILDRARAQLALICQAALEHDIEEEFVLQLISTKHLLPPPLTGPKWPWRVVIRTLGGFELRISGQLYRPTHKAQDKPLELLKLLVTCVALGREAADKSWISERLWPDADAEKARKSIEMTIARLRKLLRSEDVVIVAEGRLQLSQAHVWTDIKQLRDASVQVRLERDRAISSRAANKAVTSIAAVLEHYSGPFLAGEDDAPWLLAGREAVIAAIRHALVAADILLNGSSDDVLIPALEKAVANDPTSEDLARSLMRAHLRRGHNSEAIRVYRRLREMLSLLLGVLPSADSKFVFDQAYSSEVN